jgi:hypothetical protein
MFRLAIAVALLSVAAGAVAAPLDAQPPAPGSSSAPAVKPAVSAEPDRLLPPLPPLASLPPSAAQEVEDDAAAPRGARRTRKPSHARTRAGKVLDTPIRMVVSEQSRAYLASASSKLDAVLQGADQDARAALDAASVTMPR